MASSKVRTLEDVPIRYVDTGKVSADAVNIKTELSNNMDAEVSEGNLSYLTDFLVNKYGLEKMAVWSTLSFYQGEDLSSSDIREISYRIAGNLPRLKKGEAIPPWDRQLEEEWVVVRIRDSKSPVQIRKDGTQGFSLQMFAYNGWSAGHTFWVNFHMGTAPMVGNWIGLPKKRITWFDPPDLVGMYAYVLLRVQEDGQKPAFRRVHITSGLAKENKELLERRLDYDSCPNGFKPSRYTDCNQCHCGYDSWSPPFCKYALKPKGSNPDESHQTNQLNDSPVQKAGV